MPWIPGGFWKGQSMTCVNWPSAVKSQHLLCHEQLQSETKRESRYTYATPSLSPFSGVQCCMHLSWAPTLPGIEVHRVVGHMPGAAGDRPCEPQMPRMEALWFTDMKSKMLGMYKGKNEYWACEHIPSSTLKYMTLPLQRIFSSMNVPSCTYSVPKRSAKLCKCCHIPRIMFYLSSDPTFLDSNSMRRQISYVFLIYSCLCSLCLSLFFPSLSCSCICYSAWKTKSIQVLITRLSDTPLKMSSPIFTLVYVAGFFSMYKTHHSCITRCCCFQ